MSRETMAEKVSRVVSAEERKAEIRAVTVNPAQSGGSILFIIRGKDCSGLPDGKSALASIPTMVITNARGIRTRIELSMALLAAFSPLLQNILEIISGPTV